MANPINGYSGWVNSDGLITSNGNFTCQFDQDSMTYSVNYQGHISNAIPVISLTGNTDSVCYDLETTSGGFSVTAYADGTKVEAAFNFIVTALYG